MKPSQVINRILIKLGKGCTLGIKANNIIGNIKKIPSLEELDFDPIFLARFSVADLMINKINILHSSKFTNWRTMWNFKDKSPLWNFNLHYFEYLFPLIKVWINTKEPKYLYKTIEMIDGWIDNNPIGRGPAWASYTIALRIISWISYYSYVHNELSDEFKKKFLASLHTQYLYLTEHLEKDILGNHYFEDLKSIIIAALFFNDSKVLKKAIVDFKSECKEQILPDGMHFELSPMYHKIIFEGMMIISVALRYEGEQDKEIESYLQPMLDVAYNLENGLERIPLFNDGGNNVTKSLPALVKVAEKYFNLKSRCRTKFPMSGFYIFNSCECKKKWKLIVYAGQTGPKYIPGHAHCNAMSFELFCNGKPIIVNCGTYAYQCKERTFFRSTAAHNTVMINKIEQSQFWDIFRFAKRSNTRVLDVTDNSIIMEMKDQKDQRVKRKIQLQGNKLIIVDTSLGNYLESYIHSNFSMKIHHNASERIIQMPYAVDYGEKRNVLAKILSGMDQIEVMIDLESLNV